MAKGEAHLTQEKKESGMITEPGMHCMPSLVTSDGSNKKSIQKGVARGRMILFMILKSPDGLQE